MKDMVNEGLIFSGELQREKACLAPVGSLAGKGRPLGR
jgi:hypothetical protein